MAVNGPKKIFRISWSGGKRPNADGSKYYSDEDYLKKWLEKLIKEKAIVSIESCEPQWKAITIHELLNSSRPAK